MSQPLDFSAGARKPAPQQSEKGRPSRPKSDGPAGKKRAKTILALLVLAGGAGYVAIAVFDVFGSGKDPLSREARYCVLVGQLDQVALSTGAASSTGVYDGPPAKVKAAVDQLGSRLQQLQRLAPATVSRDQGVVVDAIKKAAAGDSSRVKAPDFAEATARISAFTATGCSVGGGRTEGE